MKVISYKGQEIPVEDALLELDRLDYEESLYHFLVNGWRWFDPSPLTEGWAIEAICEHLEAVADGEIKRLIINIPPRCSKSSVVSVAFPAWVWAQRHRSLMCGPGVQFLTGSYAGALALRDNVKSRRLIKSPWYQKYWSERFKLVGDQNTKGRFENDQGGIRIATSVDASVTGEGGNIIIIDDPNAAQEAFSEATIESTIEWWDSAMSTRLNDQKTGAFVIVQQRLSELDLTGYILEKNVGGWEHLMLPMRYEPERSYSTSIGWKDPRTEMGELLWPERFGEKEVKDLEAGLGPFACNPGEAPVLMADLSMKPIADIRPGDEIIGFEKRKRDDGRRGKFRLRSSRVTEVHQRRAAVVKMTLDSGEVIRCTRDHKWFTKDRGPDRELYSAVSMKKGKETRLARVCAPILPSLSPSEERMAGWLAGFFDGEGSVSFTGKSVDGNEYEPTASIHYFQGAGRNKPLCDKLEDHLQHFGFEFNYSEDWRRDKKLNGEAYSYRNYRLLNGGLPMLQKFLHIVKPVKWRNRIIDGAMRSNFVQQRERVVKIEPDGEETVYALTTETGNYVVWGLASSNSAGQLQQRPEPKGGGVIKREWWKLWEDGAFPPFDFIIASLDTAYTEKTSNDPSAMTIWGVFSGDVIAQNQKAADGATERVYGQQHPRVMMMHGWTERLELHDLVTKVAKTAKDYKVEKVLIEGKASGLSVAQELRRLFRHENWSVQIVDPRSQDKLSRLYSVQHLFAEGLVYAPDRKWADMVITQVGTFPKGKHDDLVDTVSQALRHLRDIGLLIRGPEWTADIQESMQHRGNAGTKPLYPA